MSLQQIRPGTQLGPGSVVQVVYAESTSPFTTTTTIPFDNTIPQNTEGAEWLTVSITPKAATNILIVRALIIAARPSSATAAAAFALFRDSGANALSTTWKFGISGDFSGLPVLLQHRLVAGSVSSTTFKVRVGGAGTMPAGALGINDDGSGTGHYGGTMRSGIEVMEVSA